MLGESLHLLILAPSLAVRFRMKPRGQVRLGSNQGAELIPKPKGELGPTIRHHVYREMIQAEDVIEDEFPWLRFASLGAQNVPSWRRIGLLDNCVPIRRW